MRHLLATVFIVANLQADGWFVVNFGVGKNIHNYNQSPQMLRFECRYDNKKDPTDCTEFRMMLEDSNHKVTDCGFDGEFYQYSYTKECEDGK